MSPRIYNLLARILYKANATTDLSKTHYRVKLKPTCRVAEGLPYEPVPLSKKREQKGPEYVTVTRKQRKNTLKYHSPMTEREEIMRFLTDDWDE